MICVSIGRGRHKHMIAEYRHLAEQGVKLVELRLDYIASDVKIKRLLAERFCPAIISCRREQDGGRWSGSEETRQMLLRAAIAEGVDYIDLEEDVAGSIPRYGKTKRIVSYHDFRQTPENIEELARRMHALDADVVKLATMANAPRDNLRMLHLVRSAGFPVAGLCMGEMGVVSRILAGRYGAPFTYATFHHERALAPGQLSYRQMTEIYHYDQIDAETDLYGVIADPIGHSLSPVIHNVSFRQLGLNKLYLPFRVPREELDDFFVICRELGVKGLSVTIPHKEAVLAKLTRRDAAVEGIGAANTVLFEGDEVAGYNTDYRAAMDAIDGLIDGGADPARRLADRTALVLGAGGVAKTLVYGLRQRGASVVVASRTLQRAEALAEAFQCTAVPWDRRHGVKPDLLVNGTPIGMHPNVDETPFEKHYLKPSSLVFDTVYNPEQTLLIKQARERGCRVITGVTMFIRQAALQFQLFTGEEAPMDLMRSTLKEEIGAVRTR